MSDDNGVMYYIVSIGCLNLNGPIHFLTVLSDGNIFISDVIIPATSYAQNKEILKNLEHRYRIFYYYSHTANFIYITVKQSISNQKEFNIIVIKNDNNVYITKINIDSWNFDDDDLPSPFEPLISTNDTIFFTILNDGKYLYIDKYNKIYIKYVTTTNNVYPLNNYGFSFTNIIQLSNGTYLGIGTQSVTNITNNIMINANDQSFAKLKGIQLLQNSANLLFNENTSINTIPDSIQKTNIYHRVDKDDQAKAVKLGDILIIASLESEPTFLIIEKNDREFAKKLGQSLLNSKTK
jgi:hypothetical protein